jgi:hypothetical protein
VLQREQGTLDIGGAPTVLGDLRLADSALPTRVAAVLTFPAGTEPPDKARVTAALTAALAFLSDSPAPARSLSFGQLLRVLPLPGRPGIPLADILAGAPGALPLPTEADVLPLKVAVAVSLQSGVTRMLEHDGDTYALSPGERLELAGVEVQQEEAHA